MVLGMIAILLTFSTFLYVHTRGKEEVIIIGAEDVEVDLGQVLKRVRIETEEGVIEITPEEANKSATLLIERALNGDKEAIREVNGTYGIIRIREINIESDSDKEFISPLVPSSCSYIRRIAFYPPLPATFNVNSVKYHLAVTFSYRAPYDACVVIIVFKETVRDRFPHNAIGFAPWGKGYTSWLNFNITIRWYECTFKTHTSHLILIPSEYSSLHVIGIIIDTGFLSGVIDKFEVLYVGERIA